MQIQTAAIKSIATIQRCIAYPIIAISLNRYSPTLRRSRNRLLLFCCSCINALPCAAQVSIVKHRRVQQLVQCQCSPPHAFPYCRTSNFAKPKGNYTPKERSTSQEKTRSRQGQDQGLLTAPVLDWTGLDWTGQLSAQTHSIVFNLTSPHLTSFLQPTYDLEYQQSLLVYHPIRRRNCCPAASAYVAISRPDTSSSGPYYWTPGQQQTRLDCSAKARPSTGPVHRTALRCTAPVLHCCTRVV